MTPEELESFYDREIAPALLELARKCEDNGMSMVAMVEWMPGETGMTATIRENAGVKLRMAAMGAQANGNADALIGGLWRYAQKHGHNSVFLSLLDRS